MRKLYWSLVSLMAWIVAGSLILLLYSSEFTIAGTVRAIKSEIPDEIVISFLIALIIISAVFQAGIYELGESCEKLGKAIDKTIDKLNKK